MTTWNISITNEKDELMGHFRLSQRLGFSINAMIEAIVHNEKSGSFDNFDLENSAKKTSPEHHRKPKDFEEFKLYCSEHSIYANDAMGLFSHWEANGWTLSGKPIKQWKAAVVSWKSAGYLPSQRKAR